ncbi:hypothetical protein [Nguyenibacter sp. L1]|uniref:hypothetical protein n=1 Tax=Nguyenibacter sp. L1 TaxID=3049350 RepID=UPI002B4A6BC4|nr:hypothetical protein [Nguyenibacter sp. L1]WRH89271.1 hypothetical protein QN315_06610 [Nguyenibacter sp. L1]
MSSIPYRYGVPGHAAQGGTGRMKEREMGADRDADRGADRGADTGRIRLDLLDEAEFAAMAPDPAAIVLACGTPAEKAGGQEEGWEDGWLDIVPLPAPGPFASGAHGAGCACCLPGGGLSAALADLFRARVTGQSRWFDRVVAVVPAALREGMRQELTENRIVAARFRPDWV